LLRRGSRLPARSSSCDPAGSTTWGGSAARLVGTVTCAAMPGGEDAAMPKRFPPALDPGLVDALAEVGSAWSDEPSAPRSDLAPCRSGNNLSRHGAEARCPRIDRFRSSQAFQATSVHTVDLTLPLPRGCAVLTLLASSATLKRHRCRGIPGWEVPDEASSHLSGHCSNACVLRSLFGCCVRPQPELWAVRMGRVGWMGFLLSCRPGAVLASGSVWFGACWHGGHDPVD
jgi:hypothetical protein